ncbi:MAG TPA: lipid-A-disaccharide synthase, partial [Syntrophobacteraceae bacterium]|nr:lipid-A-disaccharide synthase [Syntrophobacteraceae bacterium]
ERPDPVVLIDFPDFNLLLARLARRRGLRVFYYISPQVWGWRTGRVRTIRRLVDRMAVILPFEEEFYRRHGFKVHYVGHPLLDVLAHAPSRSRAQERYRTGEAGPVVGLLPGSRRSEIRSLLPILLETAALLRQRFPHILFLLPVAPGLHREEIEERASEASLPLRVVSGDTYGVIRACDLVLAASGTVTLETAILGTPLILFYRVSNLTFNAGKHLVRVPWAGLPNLIAGKMIVPEFIQDRARPDLIAAEAASFLDDPARLEAQRRELEAIQHQLGEPGVARRTARLVLDLRREISS